MNAGWHLGDVYKRTPHVLNQNCVEMPPLLEENNNRPRKFYFFLKPFINFLGSPTKVVNT